MSELQLQSLLDRTKPLDGEDEGMDMTTINGERISKYDIRAMKVGSKVPSVMRADLNKFNSDYIGAESVFPVKNGAPRILEQFKDMSTPNSVVVLNDNIVVLSSNAKCTVW